MDQRERQSFMIAERDQPIGYRSEQYASAFAHLGTPRYLPNAKTWVVERSVAEASPTKPSPVDAMGVYPLLVCSNWSKIADDLDYFTEQWVSFVAVSDPFAEVDVRQLTSAFDEVIPYKHHFVADLERPIETFVDKRRLRQAEKAEQDFAIEVHSAPLPESIERECWHLYDSHMESLGVAGLRRFTREGFKAMANTHGAVGTVARRDGNAIGMLIDYHDQDVVYAHLAAVNQVGRKYRAASAMYIFQIRYYQEKARWIDSGGAPGVTADGEHGLAKFKQAFSNSTKPVYLCTKVLQPAVYELLSAGRPGGYFPKYRSATDE